MSYWRQFYHVVWATKAREPMIDDERAAVVHRAIRAECHEVGAVVHAVGIMPAHLHVAVSIPPRLSVADMVQKLKGGTSYLLNHGEMRSDLGAFAWQAEYGVLSLGERSLEQIVGYVDHQADHHAADNLWPSFELTERLYPPKSGKTRDDVNGPGGAS